MKFAQYLEDNCTPEWKRCYLDYRRLKKQIKLIAQRQARESSGLPILNERRHIDDDVQSIMDEEDNDDDDDDDDGDLGSGGSQATGITMPPRSRGGTGRDSMNGISPNQSMFASQQGGKNVSNGYGYDPSSPSAHASSSRTPWSHPTSNASPHPSQSPRKSTHPKPPKRRSGSQSADRASSISSRGATSSEDGDAGPHAPMRSLRKATGSGVHMGFRRGSLSFSNPFAKHGSVETPGSGIASAAGSRDPNEDGKARGGKAKIDGMPAGSSPTNGSRGPKSRNGTSTLPTIEQSPWIGPGQVATASGHNDKENPGNDNQTGPTAIPARGRSRQNTQTPLTTSPRTYGSTGKSPPLKQAARFDDDVPNGGKSPSEREENGRDVSPPPSLRLPDGVEEDELTHDPSRRESVVERNDNDTEHTDQDAQILSFESGQDGHSSTTPMITKSPKTPSSPNANANKQPSKSPRMLPVGKSPRLQAWIAGGGGTGTSPDRARRQLEDVKPSTETHNGVRYPHTIEELYDVAYPDERKFFSILDGELEKVEGFYHDRESDAIKRATELKRQLAELAEHRRVFHEAERKGDPRALKALMPSMPGKLIGEVGKNLWGGDGGRSSRKPRPTAGNLVESVRPGETKRMKKPKHEGTKEKDFGTGKQGETPGERRIEDAERGLVRRPVAHKSNSTGTLNADYVDQEASGRMDEFDPEKYQRYKKSLRAAALEFYKELEILKNYRILNLTGFKKALKKFEKVAGLRSLDLYMDHKVAKRSFAQGTKVDKLLKDMEDEFTIHFEKGDHKKAVGRLRGQFVTQTHHYSAFCSGVYLGVGLPGLILGLTSALSAQTQRDLPQYDGLLQVYATLFLPVLFGMLFELNLLAYVAARINYTFIMEIDSRTAIDHRQFLEIPALLFAVLAWCFMFTMWEVGSPSITPFAWPIVWMVFTAAFFFNPVPVYYQHARYWLISVLARTLTPGYSRVEFIAFFVADELNSLVYSVSGIWFIGCSYSKGWPHDTDIYEVCPTTHNGVYGFLLCVPALIRWIQCVKRYKDSGLTIHLINAGKYSAAMLQYATFIYWRSQGSRTDNVAFAIWVPCATLYSVYAGSWDLTVDWGLLRPRYGYLRESLGYPSKALYYFAMVSNIILRFIWVFYVPRSTTKVRLRSFIFALMEMLRRWQWNFFRVETEQMGNTDQYRITREIPLPYHRMRDDNDDDDEQLQRKLSRKASKFGLQSAAIRLGDLRQRMTRRDRGEVLPNHASSAAAEDGMPSEAESTNGYAGSGGEVRH